MGKGLKEISFTKDKQMDNKYMKRCSTELVIRKMCIKATMR